MPHHHLGDVVALLILPSHPAFKSVKDPRDEDPLSFLPFHQYLKNSGGETLARKGTMTLLLLDPEVKREEIFTGNPKILTITLKLQMILFEVTR